MVHKSDTQIYNEACKKIAAYAKKHNVTWIQAVKVLLSKQKAKLKELGELRDRIKKRR